MRLLSWDCLWIHIQLVACKLRINPRYVISTPGKHINIIFQQFHQRCLFQGWNLRPHLKVFFFVLTNQNLFQFLGQHLLQLDPKSCFGTL